MDIQGVQSIGHLGDWTGMVRERKDPSSVLVLSNWKGGAIWADRKYLGEGGSGLGGDGGMSARHSPSSQGMCSPYILCGLLPIPPRPLLRWPFVKRPLGSPG